MNLDKVYGKVEHLLATIPETRSSDKRLFCEYLKNEGVDINAPFVEVMLSKIPSYESVTRTRRRLQEHHPEYAATAEVEQFREDNEGQFYIFATDKGVQ